MTETPGKRDKKSDKNGSKSGKKAKGKDSSDNGNGDAVQDHQVDGKNKSRVCINSRFGFKIDICFNI